MKALRMMFLSVIFALSAGAIVVVISVASLLVVQMFATGLDLATTNNTFSDIQKFFMSWEVFIIVLILSLLMFFKAVRIDGAKAWRKILGMSTKKFENMTDRIQ